MQSLTPIVRHITAVIFGLTVSILLLGGCADEKSSIKVGFVGSLTGRTSDLGISARDGVILAVEELNAAGGIHGCPIQLLTRDDQQDPETALKVDQDLIDQGVVAIIGHLTSQMSVVAVPLINASRILMLSPTTSTSRLSGQNDYFVRVIVSAAEAVRNLAQYARHHLGLERIVVVYDLSNRAFTEEYFSVFKSVYQGREGAQVLPLTFDGNGAKRFSDLADRILAMRPGGIVIAASALDTAFLCQHIRRIASTIPLLASGWAYTADFIQHGGPSVEGVIFPQWYNKQSDAEAFVAFAGRFEKRFGTFPNFASTFSFEAANVLFAGLKTTTDPQALKTAIVTQGRFPGLQGDIRIDRFGDADRKFFLFVVKDGQFQVMK
jgi:branched-chain amino acid transport system substrate-binding protein